MGSCATIIKPSQDTINALAMCNYSNKRELHIKIKEKNKEDCEVKTIEIFLTKPMKIEIEQININSSTMWISSCVLPGQDPQSNYFQVCLDNCMHLSDENTILLAVFDGHGPYGEKLVQFCCDFTSKFYRSQKSLLNVINI